MSVTDFEFEYHSDLEQGDDPLRGEAEVRLRQLANGHRDVTGASVVIRKPAERSSAFIYEARVVAYVRPENITAAEAADSPATALHHALHAVERQVREKRDRLRERWKQP
jgi:ribosome-associated translation inhibitor RaiA